MDACSYPPKCTADSEISYHGRPLCAKHWRALAHAGTNSEMERTMLKNLGLERVTVNVGSLVSEVRELAVRK